MTIKKHWLWALIILSLHLFLSSISLGQENLKVSDNKLELADNVKVFAKKIVRRNNGDRYEAIGNVIIIHNNDTLYGQVAHFETQTGIIEIDGNVRLINKDITLHGSNIKYYSKSKNLEITNARLSTSLYKIIARSLKKISKSEYIAKDAEYTTCKDCPESWTIYGDTVRVNIGEYIKVHEAVLRVKGVDFAYFPFFVFPIKTKRQTGFLLPHFTGGNLGGFAIFQPFFWAMSESMDSTIVPGFWKNRGLGGDFEMRKAFNSDSIFKVNARGMVDKTTRVDDVTNKSVAIGERYHTKLEVFHKFSRNLQLHFRFMELSDIDFISEQIDFSRDYVNQTEYGANGYLSYRKDFGEFGIQFLRQKSFLVDDSFYYKGFSDYSDNSVNLSPGLFFNLSPISLYRFHEDGRKDNKRNFFTNFHLGGSFEVDQFYQSEFNSSVILNNAAIRNARRLNLKPYLSASLFDNSIFSLNSKYLIDFQYYWFRDEAQSDARKVSGNLVTSFEFEFEKIFQKASVKKVAKSSKSKLPSELQTIGELGKYETSVGKEFKIQKINGYKHLQKVSLNHYYIPFEEFYGNQSFEQQVLRKKGWFDFYDSIRSREFLLGDEETRKEIPKSQTIELKWQHEIIRKRSRHQKLNLESDSYVYDRVAFFNISQGYVFKNRLYQESELTRLELSANYRFSRKLQLGLEHYYFYDSKENISGISIKNDFKFFKIYNKFFLNSFSDRANYKVGADLKIFNMMVFRIEEQRDLNRDVNTLINRDYTLFFLPKNNCWFTSLKYSKTERAGEIYSFDFAINLGQENFQSKLERIF